MVKLYVVRHGKTDWNNKNLAQGRVDIPLNDEGRKEAEKVLKNIDLDKIDICFCSPMKRTKETVEIIVGDKKEIIYDDLLVERSFGEFEGTVIDDETVFKQWDYKLNYKEKNVESLEECLERGKQFLEKIKKEYSDKTILIVSHGCLIKSLHFNIIGYDEDTDFMSFFPKNATLYEYDV